MFYPTPEATNPGNAVCSLVEPSRSLRTQQTDVAGEGADR
jgi:hypothetical protein